MFTTRVRRGLRSRWSAILLVMTVMATVSSLGSATSSFAEPMQNNWRRASRTLGGSCGKCDNPTVQYAVVTVYESADGQGKIQGYYAPGKFRADRGQLNRVGKKAISALRVEAGYKARLCQSEGDGNGGSQCQDFSAGQHNLSSEMNDQASFIWVWKV